MRRKRRNKKGNGKGKEEELMEEALRDEIMNKSSILFAVIRENDEQATTTIAEETT